MHVSRHKLLPRITRSSLRAHFKFREYVNLTQKNSSKFHIFPRLFNRCSRYFILLSRCFRLWYEIVVIFYSRFKCDTVTLACSLAVWLRLISSMEMYTHQLSSILSIRKERKKQQCVAYTVHCAQPIWFDVTDKWMRLFTRRFSIHAAIKIDKASREQQQQQ